MSGLNIIWIGLGVSAGVFFSYILVPKGQNQTENIKSPDILVGNTQTTLMCWRFLVIITMVLMENSYDDSNYVHESNSDNEDLGTEIQDIESTEQGPSLIEFNE
nr:8375_t:CDS:2 [Entrophospora candida]